MSKTRVARVVVVALVAAVAIVTWNISVEKAWPAGKCANDPDLPCRYAQKQVKKFKAGKLGTSQGYRLPKKIRKAIEDKLDKKSRVALKDDGEWWRFVFTGATCMTVNFSVAPSQAVCGGPDSMANDDYEAFNKKVMQANKIVVQCSGNVLIGAAAGYVSGEGPPGVAWGAGFGLASCFWDLWKKFVEGINFRSEPMRG